MKYGLCFRTKNVNKDGKYKIINIKLRSNNFSSLFLIDRFTSFKKESEIREYLSNNYKYYNIGELYIKIIDGDNIRYVRPFIGDEALYSIISSCRKENDRWLIDKNNFSFRVEVDRLKDLLDYDINGVNIEDFFINNSNLYSLVNNYLNANNEFDRDIIFLNIKNCFGDYEVFRNWYLDNKNHFDNRFFKSSSMLDKYNSEHEEFLEYWELEQMGYVDSLDVEDDFVKRLVRDKR